MIGRELPHHGNTIQPCILLPIFFKLFCLLYLDVSSAVILIDFVSTLISNNTKIYNAENSIFHKKLFSPN